MALLHRIPARAASIGAFDVRRVLPAPLCRKVGPWVFLDDFGPYVGPLVREADVRPHPHCALSTVTWLFEGAIEHRDSVGGHAVVRPGEIHWMRAGHGIVHSERTPAAALGTVGARAGLQLWCAHPDGEEEQEPRFDSWTSIPRIEVGGVDVQLLAGDGWGHASPVAVTSPLVYAIATMRAGERLRLPDHAERCVYALDGGVAVDGDAAGVHELLVVDGAAREVVAAADGRVVILGGAPIGPRFIWWNLVHSDAGRLREQADRWRRREFPAIPGDDAEFIPAPDGPPAR